ncbi:hypothetical protein BKA62DRAFT_769386 [Auriculariales sp. MPI-PUGE-AT-0066]|nr:hypothetical protein BKA62DRAFT_769386 [Auriculariales sp. MPI-PUGE-AT-0066]
MSRYAQYGARTLRSDGLVLEHEHGPCVMALQIRPHFLPAGLAHAPVPRGSARSLLSQTLHCKHAKRPIYLTVTHGPRTTVWRFDWQAMAGDRRRRAEAEAQGWGSEPIASLVPIATIAWAPPPGTSTSKTKTVVVVERNGSTVNADTLLFGSGGVLGNDRTRAFQSSVGLTVRWKAYAYGLGSRRFTAIAHADAVASVGLSIAGASSATAPRSPRPRSGFGASISKLVGSSPSVTLAELFPPDPGVIKPILFIYSPQQTSPSQASSRRSPDADEQRLCDDVVVTALLLISRQDDWRTVQSPPLDQIVQAELAAVVAATGRRAERLQRSNDTLPVYDSPGNLPPAYAISAAD